MLDHCSFVSCAPCYLVLEDEAMSYETEAFLDIIRISTPYGKIPDSIPAHYWRYCWALRRAAMGNKVPSVGWESNATLAKPIKLPFTSEA